MPETQHETNEWTKATKNTVWNIRFLIGWMRWSVCYDSGLKEFSWIKNFQQVFHDHINFIINYICLFPFRFESMRPRCLSICPFRLFLALLLLYARISFYNLMRLGENELPVTKQPVQIVALRRRNHRSRCRRDRHIGETTPLWIVYGNRSGYSRWHFYHRSFLSLYFVSCLKR